MSKLLRKEFLLAMHPSAPIMLLLAAMVLIPSYPYSVSFFYLGLSIFFTCLQGRENRDVFYSVLLPVPKVMVARARILYCVILQLAQMALMVPLLLLSRHINTANQTGLDASPALLGLGFLVFGLFNLVFFSGYYRNVNHVGRSFVLSSIVVFLLVVLEVISTHAVPFVRDRLDTTDPAALPIQFAALGVGAVLYLLLTLLTCRRAERLFAAQDI